MRRLLTIAWVLSLLLSAATAVLWVRSYFVSDHLLKQEFSASSQDVRRWAFHAVSYRGRASIRLERRHIWKLGMAPLTTGRGALSSREETAIFKRAALQNLQAADVFKRLANDLSPGAPPRTWVTVAATTNAPTQTPAWRFDRRSFANDNLLEVQWAGSYWMILLALAVLAVLCLWLRRRMSVRFAGDRCLKCGYSLTGNTSGVCPECGTTIAGKVEAQA